MVSALRKKDYKRAIPLAQELFENSPRWIDHLNLGRYLMQAAQTPEAGEQFLEVRATVPQGSPVEAAFPTPGSPT